MILLACSDYQVHTPDPPAPIEPAGIQGDPEVGDPPDWNTCTAGWNGIYANLPESHPDVEPEDDVPVHDPTTLDWWDDVAWHEFDPSLDFGAGWWPVNEGWAGDPGYFAVRWTAWVRGFNDTTLSIVLGSDDDAWVIVNGQIVVASPGIQDFDPKTYEVPAQAGQYPIEVRYAHREGAADGFRFRIARGDAALCYPDFSANNED